MKQVVAVAMVLVSGISFGQGIDPVVEGLQSPIPEGFLLSSNSPVSDPSDENADNVGAPLEVLAQLYAQTGANLTGIGYSWQECEPNPPVDDAHTYVWPDHSKDPFVRIERLKKIVSFDTSNKWAEEIRKTDKPRYWALLEAFIEAACRHARERYGAEFFRVPGNETSLLSCTPNPIYKPEYEDWHWYYMDQAIHVATGIKRANPDNKVFFGQLVVGDRGHVGALAQAGLRDNPKLFDVLDIHAYSPDRRVHVDMNQIVESHEVLSEIGADHIRIFLGEGWSCFPLPQDLDGNLAEQADYKPEHVDHYRNCLFSGWYNLLTPRPGEYDPAWVIGANYFTFCDLQEGRGWRRRAVPQLNAEGQIDHYLVDGYFKRPDELGPFFRPWGLVDVKGRSKGNLHLEFPPYIPKHTIHALFVEPVQRVRAGQSYRVQVIFRNDEQRTLERVRLGVTGRKRYSPDLKVRVVDAAEVPQLAPAESARGEFEVIFPDSLAGRVSRFYGEAEFVLNGKPYYVDAWGPKVDVVTE